MPQRETLQPTAPDRDTYPEASWLAPFHLLNTIALDRKRSPNLQPATLSPCWVTNANLLEYLDQISRSSLDSEVKLKKFPVAGQVLQCHDQIQTYVFIDSIEKLE
jgi:hypothetical protein